MKILTDPEKVLQLPPGTVFTEDLPFTNKRRFWKVIQRRVKRTQRLLYLNDDYEVTWEPDYSNLKRNPIIVLSQEEFELMNLLSNTK